MTEGEWLGRAQRLAAEHAGRISDETRAEVEGYGLACPRPNDLRRALVEIDELFRTAPTQVHLAYKKLAEATIRDAMQPALAEIDRGSLSWPPSGDLIAAAAAQIRALDRALFEHAEIRGPVSDYAKACLCTATNTFVLPRTLVRIPPSDRVGTKTFRRRGVFHHRLIPAEIDGYAIVPRWFADLSLSFRDPERRVAGLLFPDLTLERDGDHADFVARDAPCTSEDDALEAHVALAYERDASIAVWPELTMPPERRIKLSAILKRRSLERSPASGPAIVVAGSWHDRVGDRFQNRMQVLSSVGVPRLLQAKSLPLESRTLGIEEIEGVYEISVLVAQDILVAFAICRDFCEGQIAAVYKKLDVDLILVPSFGDLKTVAAHRRNASDLSTDHGTRTFVVQQTVAEERSGQDAGYILPPEDHLDQRGLESFLVRAPGESYALKFKRP